MRNAGERRWHGTGAVHCPPRIFHFFSSKTKGHVSSLSVDQLLRTKVAIRDIPSVQEHRREKEYVAREICSGNVFDDRPARRGKLETWKPDTARIDLIPQTSPSPAVRRPTCNRCPHPGQKCSFEQYTIPKSRPPVPPKRSSSLPKSARALEVITRPSAPLAGFELDPQDGQFFQRLVTGSSNVFGCLSNTRLWPLVLQTCRTEPCIRHIALATSMAHEAQRRKNHTGLRRLVSSHYAKAVKYLNELLSGIRVEAGTKSWELVLLASFLFTNFDALRGDEKRVYWWMQSSLMLLKTAVGVHGRKNRGSNLPGNLGEFASVFRRLDAVGVVKPKMCTKDSSRAGKVKERGCEMEIVSRRRLLRRLGEPSAFGRSDRRKARMGKTAGC